MSRPSKHRSERTQRTPLPITALLAIILLVVMFVSFAVGRFPMAIDQVAGIISSRFFDVDPYWSTKMENIVFNIRLPRILGAVLIGAGLSVAGTVYQGIFRNPMVSPDVLGASQGAAFGAAMAIMGTVSVFSIAGAAFVFGLLAVLIALLAASRIKSKPILGLVLSGIMVGSLFSAGTSFLKLVADTEDELPAITYWLMGSVSSVDMQDVAFLALPLLIGFSILYAIRWQINVLTLDEEEARSLGVDVRKIRAVVIVCATLITAACVSVSGMIGWVGLVIPHITRRIVGSDHRMLLPGSAIVGATFLLVVDNFARTISTMEVPIGILTAFIGAPFFFFILLRGERRR